MSVPFSEGHRHLLNTEGVKLKRIAREVGGVGDDWKGSAR